MPKATVSQTLKVETTVKPALKARVLALLKKHAELGLHIKRCSAEQDLLKEQLETEFTDAGEFGLLVDGVNIDGFPLKFVSSTRDVVDTMALVKRGWITLAQLKEVTESKPSKPYLKISAAKVED